MLPHLNYCCIIWGNNYESQLHKLLILQKRAGRLIEYVYPPHSSEPIFKKHNILKLADIGKLQLLLVMHKFITKQLPELFNNLYKIHISNEPRRRQILHMNQPHSNRNYRRFTSAWLGPKLWNDIMTPLYTFLDNIHTSKITVNNAIRRHFIDTYNT